ncbi:MAG TPA: hypothetical protein VHB69_04035 [Mycobacteriales bacterium]|nr:hypothetical protein [Mycobacteriales bacterium]
MPPAFMQAEVDFRIQHIKDAFPSEDRRERVTRRSEPRRSRLAALLSWGRRPNPATPSSPTGATGVVRAGHVLGRS